VTPTYHAYIVDPGRPVRTFNDLALAEAYRDKMAEMDAVVHIRRVPEPTTEEIEAELARQSLEKQP
jgi:hypothetical protein